MVCAIPGEHLPGGNTPGGIPGGGGGIPGGGIGGGGWLFMIAKQMEQVTIVNSSIDLMLWGR